MASDAQSILGLYKYRWLVKQTVLPQNDEFTPMTIWTKGEVDDACFTT